MRFWIGGPRILGMRTGVSFGPSDFRRSSRATRPTARSEAPSGGFVYVIRSDANVVKIGFSSNPINRIASLRTGSSYPLDFAFVGVTPGTGAEIEREAHRLLARHRLEGEWFDVTPEMATAAVMGAAAKIGHKLHPVAPNQVGQIIAIASGVEKMPGMVSDAPIERWVLIGALWAFLLGLAIWRLSSGDPAAVVLLPVAFTGLLMTWAFAKFT